MPSISALCSPALPITLTTSPFGLLDGSGHSVIFACTFSPSFAFSIFSLGMKISLYIRLSSGTRKKPSSDFSKVPTKEVLWRSIISTTFACFLPKDSLPRNFILTLSRLRAEARFSGWISRSSSTSGIGK